MYNLFISSFFFSSFIYCTHWIATTITRRRWPSFLSSLPIRLIDRILLPYHIVFFAYYYYYYQLHNYVGDVTWFGFDKPRAIGKVLWSEWWLAVTLCSLSASLFSSNAPLSNQTRCEKNLLAPPSGNSYYKFKNSEFQNFARFSPQFFSSLYLAIPKYPRYGIIKYSPDVNTSECQEILNYDHAFVTKIIKQSKIFLFMFFQK